MLTRKTVFVLGAGASVPFDFPTGVELSRQMVGSLQDGQFAHRTLQQIGGFNRVQVEHFRETFYRSGQNSIDSFLEHRPEFMSIGKAAIATLLIPFEKDNSVFGYEGANWLRYIYGRMSSTFDDFGKNALSFVTFNYDRVVEHFFFTSLTNSYKKDQNQCIEMLKNIPIIHLHGRLGYLPWQRVPGREFLPQVDQPALDEAVAHVKIISEDTADRDADFTLAKRLLAEAELIYFLGFGFNSTNVQRLDILNLAQGKAHATAYYLSQHEINDLKQLTNGRISFYDMDCIGLCRNIINWH